MFCGGPFHSMVELNNDMPKLIIEKPDDWDLVIEFQDYADGEREGMTKEQFCIKAVHAFMKDCNQFGRLEAATILVAYIKKYLADEWK